VKLVKYLFISPALNSVWPVITIFIFSESTFSKFGFSLTCFKFKPIKITSSKTPSIEVYS
jgi:hypothetical protein